MTELRCPRCGAILADGIEECRYCGAIVSGTQYGTQGYYQNNTQSYQPPQQQPVQSYQPSQYQPQQQPVQSYQQPQYQPPQYQPPQYDGNSVNDPAAVIDPSWPVRSKVTAGFLALFLGGLGIHKFYLNKPVLGILYLVFCWTYIPAIIAFIESIIYFTSKDIDFQIKNKVRVQ